MALRVDLKVIQDTNQSFLNATDSCSLFLKLVSHTNQAVAVTDHAGKVLLHNTLFETIALNDKAALNLKVIIKLADSAQRESVETRVSSALGMFKVNLIRLDQQPKEAEWLWLISPMENRAGNENLIRLKNLYRSFVDNMFELVFRSSSTDTLVFSNRLFAATFGYGSVQQAKGQTFVQIFKDPQDYFSIKEEALLEKQVTGRKVLFKRPDGQELLAMVNCLLYADENEQPFFNWTILDISEWSDFDKKLQQKNEQLAKANSQVEKFLYSTSHDLRAPITTIFGLVNLMRHEVQDNSILDYVDKIESSVNRLDNIIHDILNFSKAYYQRLSSVRIDFEAMVQKVIAKHSNNQAFPKIHIEVKIRGDFSFYTDAERLEMIMDNIIRNAYNFYDEHKSRSFIHIYVTIKEDQAVLEFIDNGIGIGKQFLDNIFTMFYKASHLSKGAGLGLFIVKEAVTQIGGSVGVESEVGFGSLFRVVIPNNHKGRLINRKRQLRQL